MHRLFLLISFSLFFLFAPAQQKMLIMGKVTHAGTSEVFPDVVVLIKDQKVVGHTGSNGFYAVYASRKPMRISFNFLGYKTVSDSITATELAALKGDTLRLDFQLEASLITLPVSTITASADTVIGSWKFFIEDYAILAPQRYLLLTYEKSLKTAQVKLATESAGVIASVDIPGETQEMFVDYEKHVNIFTKTAVFRVHVNGDALHLQLFPPDIFRERMVPCADSSSGRILFSNYHRDYPMFSYFSYNPLDTGAQKIRDIVDSDLLKLYNWEFDYLKPKERLYARKMEIATGIDKRIIAATMTGFAQTHYYTPLYAPLFCVRDTVCVFDHYSNKLFRYQPDARIIDSMSISYHHPQNWREWDRLLVQDQKSGEIYAVHEKGGFKYLKQIDINTGQITGSYKISNQYVKHLHVYDGEVYYIYRPYESVQKKFLYRERIQLTGE